MSENSAIIIPFPIKTSGVPVSSEAGVKPALTSEDIAQIIAAETALERQRRIELALIDLTDAFEQQKAALAAWRRSLNDLKKTMAQLGGSCKELSANLARIKTSDTQRE